MAEKFRVDQSQVNTESKVNTEQQVNTENYCIKERSTLNMLSCTVFYGRSLKKPEKKDTE